MWLCHALVKRIVEVKFVGQMPFVTPVVVYEDGEERMLGLLPFGGRGKANTNLQSGERSIISPPSPLQTPKLPQPNIKPLQDFLGQLSRNIASVLEGVIPKRESMYYRQESQKEFIRRMQKDGQLYPTCQTSNSVMTICSNCDRKGICDGLREQEAKRQKELDEKYGRRYR